MDCMEPFGGAWQHFPSCERSPGSHRLPAGFASLFRVCAAAMINTWEQREQQHDERHDISLRLQKSCCAAQTAVRLLKKTGAFGQWVPSGAVACMQSSLSACPHASHHQLCKRCTCQAAGGKTPVVRSAAAHLHYIITWYRYVSTAMKWQAHTVSGVPSVRCTEHTAHSRTRRTSPRIPIQCSGKMQSCSVTSTTAQQTRLAERRPSAAAPRMSMRKNHRGIRHRGGSQLNKRPEDGRPQQQHMERAKAIRVGNQMHARGCHSSEESQA